MMALSPAVRLLAACACLAGAIVVGNGCGEPSSPVVPTALVKVSGDCQSGTVGQVLPRLLAVKVLTARGRGVPDVPVTWVVAGGSGVVSAETTATDPAGFAWVAWKLGTAAGSDTVTAVVAGLPPAVFAAEAGAGPPAALGFAVQPSDVRALDVIRPTVVVGLRDAYGNSARDWGRVVTLAVTSGTGTSGAVLSGQLVRPVLGGSAVFADLSVDRAGTGYKVAAASSGLVGATSAAFDVAPAIVVTVQVTPTAVELLRVGGTAQLAAQARSPSGTLIPGQVFAWSSSDESKVTVSSTGSVTAVAAGTATIMATAQGVSASCTVTVASVASVEVTPVAPWILALGATLPLTARARAASGALMPDQVFTWSSGDPSVVTVSDSGVVTAVAAGTATVTAVAQGVSGRSAVTVEPRELTRVPLSAGYAHTCGLTADGTAYCWGSGRSGQLGWGDRGTIYPTSWLEEGSSGHPVSVSGGLAFVALSTGTGHTCGLTAAGMAYCWGANLAGQLGDGTTVSRTAPVRVVGGHGFVSVVTGDAHSCGLTASSEVYCWGSDSDGRVGDGTSSGTRTTPTRVVGGQEFVELTAGRYHTCGVTVNAAVYCWGANSYGQLGDGTTASRTSPVAVGGGLAFRAVSAGAYHTCGITSDGAAYCWGSNGDGRLGDGTTTARTSPGAVAGGLTFQAISAGGAYTCGLTTGGSMYCWGSNARGQFGDETMAGRAVPVVAGGHLAFRSVTTGDEHACGVTVAGAAVCWGSNADGRVGDGSWMAPNAIGGGHLFQTVSAGGMHSCGVTTSGVGMCWGDNRVGQLGDGTTSLRATPVPVAGGLSFRSIVAAGPDQWYSVSNEAQMHSCGIAADGRAYCWGGNQFGQLGDSTTTRRATPVAVSGGLVFESLTAGTAHTCGLTPEGRAYCWGENSYGQLGSAPVIECRYYSSSQQEGYNQSCSRTPVAVTGNLAFRSLSAGGSRTCGIATSGVAYCWGDYVSVGSTWVPAQVAGGLTFRSIATGPVHTCGVTSSGATYCWGGNTHGELGDGTETGSPTPVPVSGGLDFQALACNSAVGAGFAYTCGVVGSGAAYCWGGNYRGQLGTGTTASSLVPVAVAGGLTLRAIHGGPEVVCGVSAAGLGYCWGTGNGLGKEPDCGCRTTPTPVAGGLVFRAALEPGRVAPLPAPPSNPRPR